MLFKAEDNLFCEQLKKDEVRPILASVSSYYPKGIAINSSDPNFKPAIQVSYDDIYYLMIHTNSTYEGKVRVKFQRLGVVGVTESVVQDFRKSKSGAKIRVRIRDAETKEPVEANMIIDGVGNDNALLMGTDFVFSAARAKALHIESNTPGYFLFVEDVKLDKKADDNIEILIELEKLSSGKIATPRY